MEKQLSPEAAAKAARERADATAAAYREAVVAAALSRVRNPSPTATEAGLCSAKPGCLTCLMLLVAAYEEVPEARAALDAATRTVQRVSRRMLRQLGDDDASSLAGWFVKEAAAMTVAGGGPDEGGGGAARVDADATTCVAYSQRLQSSHGVRRQRCAPDTAGVDLAWALALCKTMPACVHAAHLAFHGWTKEGVAASTPAVWEAMGTTTLLTVAAYADVASLPRRNGPGAREVTRLRNVAVVAERAAAFAARGPTRGHAATVSETSQPGKPLEGTISTVGPRPGVVVAAVGGAPPAAGREDVAAARAAISVGAVDKPPAADAAYETIRKAAEGLVTSLIRLDSNPKSGKGGTEAPSAAVAMLVVMLGTGTRVDGVRAAIAACDTRDRGSVEN